MSCLCMILILGNGRAWHPCLCFSCRVVMMIIKDNMASEGVASSLPPVTNSSTLAPPEELRCSLFDGDQHLCVRIMFTLKFYPGSH